MFKVVVGVAPVVASVAVVVAVAVVAPVDIVVDVVAAVVVAVAEYLFSVCCSQEIHQQFWDTGVVRSSGGVLVASLVTSLRTVSGSNPLVCSSTAAIMR